MAGKHLARLGSMTLLRISDLGFSYSTATEPAFSGLNAVFPVGWTGVVGPNGAGKSTLLKVICTLPIPNGTSTGSVQIEGDRGAAAAERVYCDQQSQQPPPQFAEFLNAWDEVSLDLMRRLAVEHEWYYRWDTLSFGERKRAQLATALWLHPDVLAVDEPTNHLDREARDRVADALAGWNGIGIIVSHDRELLDRLCTRTLILSGGGAVQRPGGISEAMAQEEREVIETSRLRDSAAKEERRITREAQRRTEHANRSAARLSKRGLSPRDHDAAARIDAARLSGKDRRASDAARMMRERAEQAAEHTKELTVRRATFAAPARSLGLRADAIRSDTVCRLPAGIIDLSGGSFHLSHPELVVHPADRIAIRGRNGSGKSTLAHAVHRAIAPHHAPLFIAQELSADDLRSTRRRISDLAPDQRGRVLAIVTQLGSDPLRVLDTTSPSPGEARKLLLALGVLSNPSVIIMDEPTNHLDLPSVTALERALTEYPGALIVVSHDSRFLDALTTSTWHCVREGTTSRVLCSH